MFFGMLYIWDSFLFLFEAHTALSCAAPGRMPCAGEHATMEAPALDRAFEFKDLLWGLKE